MDLKEYEAFVLDSRSGGLDSHLWFDSLSMCGEAGEFAEKVKKLYRDHGAIITPEIKEAMVKELGDVLWYLIVSANVIGADLDEVAKLNIEKILKRSKNGTLQGDGDDR